MPAASDRNPNLKLNVPTLRIHKASGQWVSDLGGKTHYFGKDNQAAWEAFLPLLSEWREPDDRVDKGLMNLQGRGDDPKIEFYKSIKQIEADLGDPWRDGRP